MPFNGSGVFVRLENWSSDAASNLPISATKFDIEDNDFAGGFDLALTRDGQGTPTAPLSWSQLLTLTKGSDGEVFGLARTGGSVNPGLQFQVQDSSGFVLDITTSSSAIAIAIAGSVQETINASGVTIGSPTGGAKGSGTLNAAGLYVNGSAVPGLSASNTWSGGNTFNGITTDLGGLIFYGSPIVGTSAGVAGYLGVQAGFPFNTYCGLNVGWNGSNWVTGTDGGSNGALLIYCGHGSGGGGISPIPSTGGTSQVLSSLLGGFTISGTGAAALAAPTSGTTFTVNGLTANPALVINSASTSASPDLEVIRTSAGTANTLSAGANLTLQGAGSSGTSLQSSGNQTEIWQYNGAWNQLAYWTTSRGMVLNAPAASTPALKVVGTTGAGALALQGQSGYPVIDFFSGYLTGSAAATLTGATNKPGGANSIIGWLPVGSGGGSITGYVPVVGP
jgi:hypothetical protein